MHDVCMYVHMYVNICMYLLMYVCNVLSSFLNRSTGCTISLFRILSTTQARSLLR